MSYPNVGIAGAGTIARGLAVCAARVSDVILLARSEDSAQRARDETGVNVTTDPSDLAGRDLIVEAIVEDAGAKVELLATLGEAAPNADFASTTSSLSIADLAQRSGLDAALFGLHVFNPVAKMDLVELCFPADGQDEIRARAVAWCEALGKTPIEVPDEAGFVVNRLLFPYLFDAVRLLERTGMSAADVDTCMTLGGGHPMGPLALLDLVGIDVAVAIGEALHAETVEAAHQPPGRLIEMLGEEKLGRKSGAGFFSY
jgi:3-hydroxyacyl-CoA dehydrogenase